MTQEKFYVLNEHITCLKRGNNFTQSCGIYTTREAAEKAIKILVKQCKHFNKIISTETYDNKNWSFGTKCQGVDKSYFYDVRIFTPDNFDF